MRGDPAENLQRAIREFLGATQGDKRYAAAVRELQGASKALGSVADSPGKQAAAEAAGADQTKNQNADQAPRGEYRGLSAQSAKAEAIKRFTTARQGRDSGTASDAPGASSATAQKEAA